MRLKALILATAMGLSTSLLAAQAMAGPLASVFSDHAVLQRDQPIRVWGKTTPRATVVVGLEETGALVTADALGRWLSLIHI